MCVTPGASFGETSKQETVTVLNELQYNVVIGGDSLTRLAGRFGVSKESILKANPTLAARTNPNNRHWLYLGETLVIPVFQAVPKNLDEIGDATIVVVPMRVIREKDAEIARALGDVSTLAEDIGAVTNQLQVALKEKQKLEITNDVFFWLFITLAIFFALSLIFLIVERGNRSWHEQLYELAMKIPRQKTELTSNELVEIVRTSRVGDVATFADSKILKDECGNPVSIKKLPEFFAKRPHLSGLTLLECEDWLLIERAGAEK